MVVHPGPRFRVALVLGAAARGRALLDIDGAKPLLVVTGGSLGADALNRVVREALPRLLTQYQVLHVCGRGKLAEHDAPGYLQREYVGDGWGDMLAAADVVVSRAGANALFELLTLSKLNLLVPLSAQASRGDQIQNAAYAQGAGYSVVLQEHEFDADSLLQGLQELQQHRSRYFDALAQFETVDATAAIVRELEQLGKA